MCPRGLEHTFKTHFCIFFHLISKTPYMGKGVDGVPNTGCLHVFCGLSSLTRTAPQIGANDIRRKGSDYIGTIILPI